VRIKVTIMPTMNPEKAALTTRGSGLVLTAPRYIPRTGDSS
jgi:hypothetical protein